MSQDLFDTSVSFADLGLTPDVVKGLTDTGFVHPTDIQAKLIPAIMNGKDVIGQARTGTGKTAAFGLPIFSLADKSVSMQGLILTPTRELATQVAAELDALGKHTGVRTTCIIGGESMRAQQKSVERGGHIIVGTPGRVMDMYGRRQIHFDNIRFVVLDEVDRMLDIGFREDIKKILRSVRGDHQTIFVSATVDRQIESLARSFMKKDAEKITTVSGSLTVSMVDQKHLSVEPWDKRSLLLHLIRHEDPDTTVVFCKTKATVHKITKYLCDKGIHAREIHGDLHQRKRTQVMDSMREGNLDVLIASDLAARGLDVEHITHVINYDLPEDPEVYVHRIGRTARVGRRGTAWSFVTPDQGQLLTEIEKISGAMIEKFDYPQFEPGPVPEDIRDDRAAERRRASAPARTLESRVATGIDVSGYSEDELKAMFPDGNIPKNLPKRGLGGKFRTRRG
jgi:ATP-dependent RNA helicase DeaD